MDRFFLIGGTEKAGTTAIFNFFYNHPEVNPSVKKETDFFRKTEGVNKKAYLREFSPRGDGVFFEASPGYLAASELVLKNISAHLYNDDVKFVFVLRDPVDRLLSSFNFHKSRGYIDTNIKFGDYFDAAIRYKEAGLRVDGVSEWSLESVFHGLYAKHIERYFQSFSGNVRIIDYDFFKKNPAMVVEMLCDFSGIEKSYFSEFEFFSANKTFRPKYQKLHSLLININKLLAPFFYKYPKLKNNLLAIYKKINQGASDRVDEKDILRVRKFYLPSVLELCRVLSERNVECPGWTNRYIEEGM